MRLYSAGALAATAQSAFRAHPGLQRERAERRSATHATPAASHTHQQQSRRDWRCRALTTFKLRAKAEPEQRLLNDYPVAHTPKPSLDFAFRVIGFPRDLVLHLIDNMDWRCDRAVRCARASASGLRPGRCQLCIFSTIE